MKKLIIFLPLLLISAINIQNKNEENITTAFQNAKKGMYYALSNIPEDKSRLNRELVDKNKLFAKVKLSKEVNGIKIESTGYSSSTEVTIKIYRSFESLEKDGYLKQEKTRLIFQNICSGFFCIIIYKNRHSLFLAEKIFQSDFTQNAIKHILNITP